MKQHNIIELKHRLQHEQGFVNLLVESVWGRRVATASPYWQGDDYIYRSHLIRLPMLYLACLYCGDEDLPAVCTASLAVALGIEKPHSAELRVRVVNLAGL